MCVDVCVDVWGVETVAHGVKPPEEVDDEVADDEVGFEEEVGFDAEVDDEVAFDAEVDDASCF